ncbi:MAG: putative addiction module antidote protein [Candidatus Electrothrix sp. AR4]|nr:putative addiction module antidote protein [Candidatus Electrothrix sp. AR4]
MRIFVGPGLNRESLYKSFAGEGNPRFSTVSRVIKALGCRLAGCV